MIGENLITSSNIIVQTNNCSEKKVCSGIGTASSIAFAIFLGTTMLQYPVGGEIIHGYDLTSPLYTEYINLEQEIGTEGLDTNKAIDVMKIDNLDKIRKMALFSYDWNGTGGSAFSQNAIALFKSIIEMLDKQPQIAPTGRNSLLLQYELDDKSLLAFEVSENQTEKVYIPKGNYAMVQMDTFTENIGQQIKECVKHFYGIR